MPKRGIDAGSRLFFDELESLAASRLKATRAIRLEDRYGVIAFSDEDHVVKRQKFVGVTHTKFPNGGGAISFIRDAAAGNRSSGSSRTRRAA